MQQQEGGPLDGQMVWTWDCPSCVRHFMTQDVGRLRASVDRHIRSARHIQAAKSATVKGRADAEPRP